MPTQASYGVVSVPALDLRALPSHASEMRSQLLLGEVAEVLSGTPGREWLRVRAKADGYRGWVRSWGLVLAGATRAGVWERVARARVTRAYLEARAYPGRGSLVTPLFWGARVIPGPRSGRHRRVELPDGRRGWVPESALAAHGRPTITLSAHIGALAGTPYLWGGRTPFGLDCSGFTQLVLGEQGVRLPRDSRQQFRASRALGKGDSPRLGDLLFFGRPGAPPSHVGIWLGRGLFAHVRGHVRLASLLSDNPLYDKEIAAQFIGLRRPRMTGWKGRGSEVPAGESA